MIDKSGWNKVKLGDVVQHVKDTVNVESCDLEYYLGGEHFNTDDLHINGKGVIKGSTIGPAFIMRFKPGQVLLVSRNPHLRKMAVVDFESICSNVTYVCETKSELLLQEFLPFVMRSGDFWRFAEANKRGSTNFYLNWTDFARYEFLLPPIEEQKRIAELLWAADEVADDYLKCETDLNVISDGLVNEMISHISSKSDTCTLGELINYRIGQVDPKSTPYRDMPLLAPNHIVSGTGQVVDMQTAAEQNAVSGKYLFEKGEIVYSKIRPSLNKVIIADFNGICSADMYPISVKGDNLTIQFLYYLLSSKIFVDYATACSIRTSIPKLNRTDMSKFSFRLPTLTYQNYFSNKMDALSKAKFANLNKINHSKKLLKNLIEHYLGGAN